MNDKIEAMEASIDCLSKDIIPAFTWGTQKMKKLKSELETSYSRTRPRTTQI
jgi:hypothetical protein